MIDGAVVGGCLVAVYVLFAVVLWVVSNVSYSLYALLSLVAGLAPLVVCLAALGISVAGVGRIGASIGKRTMGVRVQDVTTGGPIGVARALVRAVILGVMALPCYLGYVTFFTDSSGRNRALHDTVADDVAVSVARVPFVQSVKDVLAAVRAA